MGTEALLGGRYRLDSVAGHGGMATVFSAHDTVLERKVAVKILQRRRDETGVLHERFEREARAEAKITHPNVVSVHDVGETDDGRPFIVMDYVEGGSLQSIIAREGALTSERVALVGCGIARALAAAHAIGIVHRDVKPANVIVDAYDTAHLMDFGLARDLYEPDAGMTVAGAIVGTPFYIAPEQVRFNAVSPAADLYALGCVMYHALTGEPPFTGDGAVDVAFRRFEEEPAELRAVAPAADPDLRALIHALLARDPVERPWDARAVAERLADIAARLRATRTAGETQVPL